MAELAILEGCEMSMGCASCPMLGETRPAYLPVRPDTSLSLPSPFLRQPPIPRPQAPALPIAPFNLIRKTPAPETSFTISDRPTEFLRPAPTPKVDTGTASLFPTPQTMVRAPIDTGRWIFNPKPSPTAPYPPRVATPIDYWAKQRAYLSPRPYLPKVPGYVPLPMKPPEIAPRVSTPFLPPVDTKPSLPGEGSGEEKTSSPIAKFLLPLAVVGVAYFTMR